MFVLELSVRINEDLEYVLFFHCMRSNNCTVDFCTSLDLQIFEAGVLMIKEQSLLHPQKYIKELIAQIFGCTSTKTADMI